MIRAVLRWDSWLHRDDCPASRTSLRRIIGTLIMASEVAVSRSSGHSMAGMDMSGGSGMAAMSLIGTGRKLAAGLLALVLLAFALRWLARAFDAARAMPAGVPEPAAGIRADALSPACHAAMALGMAVMFVLLL